MTDMAWIDSEIAFKCLFDVFVRYHATHDAREINEMARRKALGLIPDGMTPEDHMILYGDGSTDRPMGILSAGGRERK